MDKQKEEEEERKKTDEGNNIIYKSVSWENVRKNKNKDIVENRKYIQGSCKIWDIFRRILKWSLCSFF